MASEATITINFAVRKSFTKLAINDTVRIDVSGSNKSDINQTIGTAYEAVTVAADVTTPGLAYFRNLDAANYVEIGVAVAAVFYPLLKLKPGEHAIARLAPTAALFARADTAAVILQTTVMAD